MTTNATMAVYYRTSFAVKGSDEIAGLHLLNAVSDAVFEWAKNREPIVNEKVGQWREEDKCMVRLYGDQLESEDQGYYALTFERAEDYDGLERPGVQENRIWWDLKLQLATDGNDVSVTVEDECINGLRPLDDMAWPPPVVAKLFDEFSCFLGESRIASKAKRVYQEQANDFVRREVFNIERLLPVIVVRDDINNVDADAIQSYFRGQATVVTYGEDAAWDVNAGLGRSLACRAGAVRIYWPNCTLSDEPQDHRQFEPRNVVERLGNRLQLVLRDEFVSYFPSEEASNLFNKARATFNDVSSKVQEIRRGELGESQDVDRILGELAGREQDLWQENLRLRRQIEQLTAENAQLKAENDQLNVAREYEEERDETSQDDTASSLQEYTVIKYRSRGNRRSPFDEWCHSLDLDQREKIDYAIERMVDGNFGDAKALGGGLMERRLDMGPGYRIYYTKEKDNTIVLFGGGDKGTQSNDIQRMRSLLMVHRRR